MSFDPQPAPNVAAAAPPHSPAAAAPHSSAAGSPSSSATAPSTSSAAESRRVLARRRRPARRLRLREFRPDQREIVDHLVGRRRRLRAHADRRRQVALLPAPGHRAARHRHRRLAAHLAHEGPGRRAARGRRAAPPPTTRRSRPARRGGVLRPLHAGELDLLYVAPERLMTDGFLERLRGARRTASPVRHRRGALRQRSGATTSGPSTSSSGSCASLFPDVPIMACTATADPQTRDDVALRLGLADAAVFVAGFDRPNIRYTVVEKREPLRPAPAVPARATRASPASSTASRASAPRRSPASCAAARRRRPPPTTPACRRDERGRVQDAFARDEVARRRRHRRLRHGHRQARRALRRPLRPAQEPRELLPGDRPRRPRRPARRGPAALRPRRRRRRAQPHRGRRPAADRATSGSDPEQVRIELHKLNAMVGFAEASPAGARCCSATSASR